MLKVVRWRNAKEPKDRTQPGQSDAAEEEKLEDTQAVLKAQPKAYVGAMDGSAEGQTKEGNKTSVETSWRDVECVE